MAIYDTIICMENSVGNNNESVRVAIISALIAFCIGVLAILHGDDLLLGFFVLGGGFVRSIYNFVIVLLIAEVIFGLGFLLASGYVYGFSDNVHDKAEKMQKVFYTISIRVFPISLVSILYSTILKAIGVDSFVGVLTTVCILVLFILSIVVVLFLKKKRR